MTIISGPACHSCGCDGPFLAQKTCFLAQFASFAHKLVSMATVLSQKCPRPLYEQPKFKTETLRASLVLVRAKSADLHPFLSKMKSALTGIHKNNANMHRHESPIGQDRQNHDSQETSKFRPLRSIRFQDTAFGKVKITSSALWFIILRYSGSILLLVWSVRNLLWSFRYGLKTKRPRGPKFGLKVKMCHRSYAPKFQTNWLPIFYVTMATNLKNPYFFMNSVIFWLQNSSSERDNLKTNGARDFAIEDSRLLVTRFKKWRSFPDLSAIHVVVTVRFWPKNPVF